MNLFEIRDHADQQFGTIINSRRVTIRLRYNTTIDRWSFDLSIDDEPVLYGRRVVTGVDLLAAFDFGIGMIFASVMRDGGEPSRSGLVDGSVRMFSASLAEYEAANA